MFVLMLEKKKQQIWDHLSKESKEMTDLTEMKHQMPKEVVDKLDFGQITIHFKQRKI